jgi:hypothetical protein
MGNIVIGRLYFERQAKTLLAFAKTTRDPNLAAVLIERAADLTAKAEEPRRDVAPRAPDVEPVKKRETA